MSLILHDWELSADAYRVRLLLALLQLSYAKVPVDAFPGRETEGAAFRRLSPAGTLPVLVDGRVVLRDVAAILIHLAETRDRAGSWLPSEPTARAACLQWLGFALGPLRAGDAARAEAMLGRPAPLVDAPGTARRALRVLEGQLVRQALRGEAFLAGAAPTLADVAAFPAVALAVDWGETLEALPKARLWLRRIRALDGFVATPGVPEFL
ncbi:MAG: glutathione S-transferase family protein [Pseudomonadota bacterium]